jgi:hypothetical protein
MDGSEIPCQRTPADGSTDLLFDAGVWVLICF